MFGLVSGIVLNICAKTYVGCHPILTVITILKIGNRSTFIGFVAGPCLFIAHAIWSIPSVFNLWFSY